MKNLVKKYGYFIPNKYKTIDTSKYKFSKFSLLNKEWKWNQIDLSSLSEVVENEVTIESNSKRINRESRSSLAIEDVYEETTKNYSEYLSLINEAREELFKYEYLNKELINKIYLIASDNEKLIDKNNIKLEGKSLFRNDDIYIGGKKVLYKGKELENHVEELCEFVNDLINEDEIFLAAINLHFFFEHLHPLPDYNGRIGRLLLSWALSKEFSEYNLSNYIFNNKNAYYDSISLSEKHNDITYSIIFLIEAIMTNYKFALLFTDKDGKSYEVYNKLNEPEKQALFNLFTKTNEFGWKEYKEYFKDPRGKQQIHNILSSLEKQGLIKSRTYSNNMKRYYYSK